MQSNYGFHLPNLLGNVFRLPASYSSTPYLCCILNGRKNLINVFDMLFRCDFNSEFTYIHANSLLYELIQPFKHFSQFFNYRLTSISLTHNDKNGIVSGYCTDYRLKSSPIDN